MEAVRPATIRNLIRPLGFDRRCAIHVHSDATQRRAAALGPCMASVARACVCVWGGGSMSTATRIIVPRGRSFALWSCPWRLVPRSATWQATCPPFRGTACQRPLYRRGHRSDSDSDSLGRCNMTQASGQGTAQRALKPLQLPMPATVGGWSSLEQHHLCLVQSRSADHPQSCSGRGCPRACSSRGAAGSMSIDQEAACPGRRLSRWAQRHAPPASPAGPGAPGNTRTRTHAPTPPPPPTWDRPGHGSVVASPSLPG